eukprot:m.35684 g.35684  ORF g.35684 m.35684 type:complete len:417 (+) comp12796_c0_seq1:405-1655(+)
MAHAGTAADQLRPSSGGAMPSPVANAWVRPLKGTVAARNGNGSAAAAPRNPNGHSAVRAGGTKNGHGHDRVKDQHDDPHATAEPHPTKTKTVAPPPTNPWKTPMVEAAAQPIEVEAAPVKKGKNVKSWPTLGEAPKEQPDQKSAVASAGPAEGDKSSKPKSTSGKKEKWVPFAEELPLHTRRADGTSWGSNERASREARRPARPQKKTAPNGAKQANGGGPSAGATGWSEQQQHSGYAAQSYPTFQPSDGAAAAAFYPQQAYHQFAPEFTPAGMANHGANVPMSDSDAVLGMPDPVAVQAAILYQVEYYMSVENLMRDFYLRQQMDVEGWVPIAHIATFKRLSMLTLNVEDIVASLGASVDLEVLGGAFVRRRVDWHKFVPAMPRDPAAAGLPPSPSSSNGSSSFNVMARAFVPGR